MKRVLWAAEYHPAQAARLNIYGTLAVGGNLSGVMVQPELRIQAGSALCRFS